MAKSIPTKISKQMAGLKIDTTNLKFIGSAFEQAIFDLQLIKANARDPKGVQAMIDSLTDLKTKTGEECPQGWYCKFDVR